MEVGGGGAIGVNQIKIIFNNVSLITFLNDIPQVNPSSATVKLHDVSIVFIGFRKKIVFLL